MIYINIIFNPFLLLVSFKCLDVVPASLLTFLRKFFVWHNNQRHLAFIGQAIVQQVRPKTLKCPLQLATAIHVHRNFGSKELNDELYAMGFALSYGEALRFERNAAVIEGTDIDGIEDSSFIQVLVIVVIKCPPPPYFPS